MSIYRRHTRSVGNGQDAWVLPRPHPALHGSVLVLNVILSVAKNLFISMPGLITLLAY